MIKISRDDLNKLLHVDVITVTFTKKNGDERVMRCTLKEDLLPKREIVEGEKKKERPINLEVMPVYDLDAKGFRSFRMDSIKSIKSIKSNEYET